MRIILSIVKKEEEEEKRTRQDSNTHHSLASPIEFIIIDVTHPVKEISEQFTQVIVVGPLEKV